MNSVLKRTITAIGLILGLMATAVPAQAAYTVTFENVGPSDGASAGQYNWHVNGTAPENILYTPGTNGSSSSQHFVSFCIQTGQHISGGTTYSNYTFTDLESAPVPGTHMLPAQATSVRQMWAQYRSTLDVGSATDKAYKSAAFQFAVWYLTGQLFPYTIASEGGAKATAIQGYFNLFTNSTTWISGEANLKAMVSDGNQDQIFELGGGGGNLETTPAPPAAILALAGIVPGLVFRRRLTGKTA